ncbi:Na/Pi symporter [Brevibacterium litoralis]|uniref:Na/Pi symporter n=1 Tax=Brevibacterium litoralis TaxID=3138935 RepID=UPI0032EED771
MLESPTAAPSTHTLRPSSDDPAVTTAIDGAPLVDPTSTAPLEDSSVATPQGASAAEGAAPSAVATEPATPQGPFDRFLAPGPARSVVNWLAVVLAVYVLVSAVGVIGAGFKTATGDHAPQLFAFAENPLVALMVGILATAALQSSSTTTSITVGLAAGGLPLEIAIPIIFGANIGTTLTNTLVALGSITRKDEFRRSFAAATVHDFFNLIAVLVFLPLEYFTGFFRHLSGAIATALPGGNGVDTDSFDLVGAATSPLKDGLGALASPLGSVFGGVVMVLLGVVLIFFSIGFLGKLLKTLMVGRAKAVLHGSIGRGPVTGIGAGALVTAVVQSSSTSTSLMVPLAASGTFSLRQVYPFAVGANIGTTITALLAALGLSGVDAVLGLQVAVVHLLFNLCATLVVFGIPVVRELPLRGAAWLAGLAARRTWIAAVWVLGVFVALPAVLIVLTAVF